MNQRLDEKIEERHRIEEEFHDARVTDNKEVKKHYNAGPSNYAVEKLIRSIGDYRGKRVLEFGCGSDGLAIYLGRRGAITDGFDISGESIRLANERVREYGIEKNVTLKKMSAEKLEYPDNTFDIVLGNAILHHCDLPTALSEIHRVLKDDSWAYFIEPLGHNIFLRIYRFFTPEDRSTTERPLLVTDFRVFQNTFSVFAHEEFFFLTLLSFFWHFVIPNQRLFEWSFNSLLKSDKVLLSILPFLKKYCWIVLLKFKK